jgi:hypothetical protein
MAVDVRDEVKALARRGEFGERQHRHLRAEVGAADADVDHVGDRVVAAHLLGIGQHRVERFMHLAQLVGRLADLRIGGGAQQRVQHGAVFGVVDVLAREHRVAVRLEAALAGQREQQLFGARVDQVLGQVGEHMRRLLAEALEAPRVVHEGMAHVELAARRLEGGLQLRPGRRTVAALGHVGHGHVYLPLSCMSFSSFTASAAKARMPSASFSVAIASSLSAKRKPASS